MSQHEATVEVLTAEVRVLMVGSRQITLSVVRQLDKADPGEIKPFGRIRTGARPPFAAQRGSYIEVIGTRDGILVRGDTWPQVNRCDRRRGFGERLNVNGQDAEARICSPDCRTPSHFWTSYPDVFEAWSELPLIVLAGLR